MRLKLKINFYIKYMAYKKKSSFSKVSKYSKSGGKKTTNTMTPRTATQTIKKYVKSQIARQIENKCSQSYILDGDVMQYNATDPVFYNYHFGSNIFSLTQGVQQGMRVGDSVKLKRWIIKGFITPNDAILPGTTPTPYDPKGFQGTVKLMLLKTRNNIQIDNALSQLLQNGNSSVNPLGKQSDKLMPINTDKYKIYWSREFKMAAANNNAPIASYANYYPVMPNNDFKLCQSFGFNVLDYIGKDAKITFNDSTTAGILPGHMANLSLAAYWSPFTGDMTQNSTNYRTFYKISVITYYEYEDA